MRYLIAKTWEDLERFCDWWGYVWLGLVVIGGFVQFGMSLYAWWLS
jgi:hypothetical protein